MSGAESLDPRTVASNIYKYAEEVKRRYQHNEFMIEHYDKEMTDLNHLVELTSMSAKDERLAIKQMRENRRKRRICKDENILLFPLYEFLTKRNDEMLNALRTVSRHSDKQKAYVDKQEYKPRTGIVSAEVFKAIK